MEFRGGEKWLPDQLDYYISLLRDCPRSFFMANIGHIDCFKRMFASGRFTRAEATVVTALLNTYRDNLQAA